MSNQDRQPLVTFITFILMIVIIIGFLTGCSTTVPVIAKFPDVPEDMLKKCEPLKTIDTETTVFSELSKNVTSNYTQYHLCATKSEGWIEWYTTQKKIYESVK